MRIQYFSILLALAFTLQAVMLPADSDNKPRVGILDFEARNVPEVEAEAVGEIFTSELVANGRFDIVDRKNVESLLEEMDFQLSGCTDSSCAVEVGRILSLEYMIYGSVIKLGNVYSINVQMINVATAQIVNTGRDQFASIEGAYDIIPSLVASFTTDFFGEVPAEPAAVADKKKPPSQRQKTGMITFFSGIGVTLASTVLWMATAEYNNDEVWIAHDNYYMADITELDTRKEEYLAAFRQKNIMLLSSAIVTTVGVAGTITGSVLWFGEDK